MERHPLTANEEARLAALRNLHLLDTAPNEAYDRITRMTSRLLRVPVSSISLSDRHRQFFKSRVGFDLAEAPREQTPCHWALRSEASTPCPTCSRTNGSAIHPSCGRAACARTRARR